VEHNHSMLSLPAIAPLNRDGVQLSGVEYRMAWSLDGH
jgi:hypothetical protein